MHTDVIEVLADEPRRPSASSKATPPTTGGSTIGSSVIARTSERPGYETRAWTHASGTPSTIAIAVAASDVSIESRSACARFAVDQHLPRRRPRRAPQESQRAGSRRTQCRTRRPPTRSAAGRSSAALDCACGRVASARRQEPAGRAAPAGPGRKRPRRRRPAPPAGSSSPSPRRSDTSRGCSGRQESPRPPPCHRRLSRR